MIQVHLRNTSLPSSAVFEAMLLPEASRQYHVSASACESLRLRALQQQHNG